MTNTLALTDYDVYDDEYDNFTRKYVRRRYPKRAIKKRRTKRLHVKRYVRSSLPRPIGKPKVIKGRPTKLPPIKVKGLPVVPRRKPLVKSALIKVKKRSVIEPKTPIKHLIKKKPSVEIKPTLSATSKNQVKQIEKAQLEISKKTMESDKKTSKTVKVVAIVGVVGITGFGIYKFIQNKNKNNGHISTSK